MSASLRRGGSLVTWVTRRCGGMVATSLLIVWRGRKSTGLFQRECSYFTTAITRRVGIQTICISARTTTMQWIEVIVAVMHSNRRISAPKGIRILSGIQADGVSVVSVKLKRVVGLMNANSKRPVNYSPRPSGTHPHDSGAELPVGRVIVESRATSVPTGQSEPLRQRLPFTASEPLQVSAPVELSEPKLPSTGGDERAANPECKTDERE